MDDTVKDVAERLLEFINRAENKARAGGLGPPGPPGLLATCKECLGKLDKEEELDKFDSMIKKMSGALGDPPGAIPRLKM